MANNCKYNRLETVVSYDGGVSWESQNPPVYHKGELIEIYSQDCETGITLERWIVIEGDYLCEGNNKYKKELQEISYDGGVNWYPSSPTTFRLGQFVSVDAEYCSYLFEGHYDLPTEDQICAAIRCPFRLIPIVWYGKCQCIFGKDPIKIVKCPRNVVTQELLLNGDYALKKLSVGVCATEIAGNAANHPYLRSIETLDLSNATNLTTIGDSAFAQCSSLTSVTIPNSVTSIGNNAFTGCTALSSITVDSHNTTYDSRNNCNSIIETSTNRLIVGSNTSTIPSGVTSIGYGAFTNKNGLRSVVIPDSVTNFERPETSTVTFPDYAFRNCTSLSSVTISNNITKLYGSFRDCTSLSNVTIPRSVDHIGLGAFRGCTSLTAITVEATTPPVMGRNEDVFDDTNNCPIYVPCGTSNIYKSATGWSKYASRILEDQVSCIKFIVTYSDTHTESGDCISSTTISSTDISNKGDVVSIEIGSCAALIDVDAFSGCTILTSCTIGSGVISIRQPIFKDCANLSSITVDSHNTTYDSRNNCNAIIETSTNNLIVGCKNSTIPSSVTSIGDSAFDTCTSLSSVTIPNSVTSIGVNAFFQCSSLSNITIPNSVVSIGDGAFSDCTSLTSVTIPNSVTSIGSVAFFICYNLTSVTIGSGVTSIGDWAFYGCSGLTSVTVNATTPPALGNIVFDDTNSCPIYVPASSVDVYKAASGWSSYSSRIYPIP